MTRFVGPIQQIGVIVQDAEAEARHWAECIGAGPFVFFRKIAFDADYQYRGQATEPPVVTIAVGHSGATQIEIIQQHNEAPSAYREYLDSGRQGMQHVSTWCGTPRQYDEYRARMLSEGHAIVHEGRVAGTEVRFAYFETASKGWPLLEISEALLPVIRPLSQLLEAMNSTWDGQQPFLDFEDIAGRLQG
ncbi:MAG: VOC family protein [Pseudoxanthomonas sp.]